MLRVAYVGEFLLALLTISVVWGQVGGQDHLDLIPWYQKLVLILALGMVVVVGTAAAAAREHAWNGTVFACLLMALLLMGAMAAVTYYYHVHEEQDQDTDNTAGVVRTLLRIAARPPG